MSITNGLRIASCTRPDQVITPSVQAATSRPRLNGLHKWFFQIRCFLDRKIMQVCIPDGAEFARVAFHRVLQSIAESGEQQSDQINISLATFKYALNRLSAGVPEQNDVPDATPDWEKIIDDWIGSSPIRLVASPIRRQEEIFTAAPRVEIDRRFENVFNKLAEKLDLSIQELSKTAVSEDYGATLIALASEEFKNELDVDGLSFEFVKKLSDHTRQRMEVEIETGFPLAIDEAKIRRMFSALTPGQQTALGRYVNEALTEFRYIREGFLGHDLHLLCAMAPDFIKTIGNTRR